MILLVVLYRSQFGSSLVSLPPPPLIVARNGPVWLGQPSWVIRPTWVPGSCFPRDADKAGGWTTTQEKEGGGRQAGPVYSLATLHPISLSETLLRPTSARQRPSLFRNFSSHLELCLRSDFPSCCDISPFKVAWLLWLIPNANSSAKVAFLAGTAVLNYTLQAPPLSSSSRAAWRQRTLPNTATFFSLMSQLFWRPLSLWHAALWKKHYPQVKHWYS